jgi:acyl carrier protein
MIPLYFVFMEAFPLTAGGKIDRKALPDPEIKHGEYDYVSPVNETEEQLETLWSEVLGIGKERIGRFANFFEQGGHSLKATVMTARVHKYLGVRVPLTEIFKDPTIAGLAGYIERTEKEAFDSIPKAGKQSSYSLSAAQKRLYVLQQMDKENTGYNILTGVTLEGQPDEEKLENAFKQLIRRHESLRTSFIIQDGEPRQWVHEHEQVDFKVDFKTRPVGSIVQPFDLARAPLLRVGVFQTRPDTRVLWVDMHHIITDGTSCALLVREFVSLYAGHRPAPMKLQYKDFSQWQNSERQQRKIARQKEFWLEVFAGPGPLPVLELPLDFPRPSVQSFEGEAFDFALGEEETAALNRLALSQEATLFMTLMAVYKVLLWRLSGQEDVVVGTPTAGRGHADLDDVIGMFINTLALRQFPAGDKTFNAFLAEVKNHTLQAFENQDYPFEELVNRLSISRDTGRHPLFDTMFTLQNLEVMRGQAPEASLRGLTVKPFAYEKKTTHFDMDVTALETGPVLTFRIDYCTKLFKKETIERLSNYFRNLVRAVTAQPGMALGDIEIIGEKEKKQVMESFNQTAAPYPGDKTIHQLFEEQAARTPDRIALTGAPPGSNRTYKELNRRARHLAMWLLQKGAGPGRIVAIKMDRRPEMITAILGVLKSGSAYLPVDPGLPEERIQYMLTDSNAAIVLDGVDVKPVSSVKTGPVSADGLAYVIYTSGSTGRTTCSNMIRRLSA